MAIGMNKGRGVGRAKAGIGVPKRAPGKPNTAKYTTPKKPASGPMRGNLKGFDIGKGK